MHNTHKVGQTHLPRLHLIFFLNKGKMWMDRFLCCSSLVLQNRAGP